MSEPYTLRRASATLADARALLTVEQASLADSPYSAAEVQRVLARPEHYAYLAMHEGVAVGFCSCLETPTPRGPRLEVDLLGVLPEHRGRRLATRLIRLSLQEAERRGLRQARGVAREDNIASQRTFVRAGLRAGAQPHELLAYAISGTSPVPPPAEYQYTHLARGEMTLPAEGPPTVHTADAGGPLLRVTGPQGDALALVEYLRVETLSYAGLWIERPWAASPAALRAALRALVEEAKRLGLDEVGHLAAPVAPSAADPRDHWLREGFAPMGRYLVFAREGPLVQPED